MIERKKKKTNTYLLFIVEGYNKKKKKKARRKEEEEKEFVCVYYTYDVYRFFVTFSYTFFFVYLIQRGAKLDG